VRELASVSRLASERLPKSQVISHEGGVITIEFERVLDSEWVADKPKIRQAIVEEWKKRLDEPVQLQFTARVRTPETLEIERSTVELSLEGAELEQAAREVFGAEKP